jgi:Sulfotransferase family
LSGRASPEPGLRHPVFIIGCARSGRTWLGTIFARSEGFHTTIEDPRLFPLVDGAVLYWHRRALFLDRLIPRYREQLLRAGECIYVDKSHQNIWLVEELDKAFSSALYVALERAPYAAIASMMQHFGVRRHFVHWRRYPVPNAHLGITHADAPGYDALPLSIKCALRWRSHHERLEELRRTLGDRLHVLCYEDLVEETDVELAKLATFVGKQLQPGVPSRAALEKWHQILSRRQINEIDRVLGEKVRKQPTVP